jgi:hypothetical protein
VAKRKVELTVQIPVFVNAEKHEQETSVEFLSRVQREFKSGALGYETPNIREGNVALATLYPLPKQIDEEQDVIVPLGNNLRVVQWIAPE